MGKEIQYDIQNVLKNLILSILMPIECRWALRLLFCRHPDTRSGRKTRLSPDYASWIIFIFSTNKRVEQAN